MLILDNPFSQADQNKYTVYIYSVDLDETAHNKVSHQDQHYYFQEWKSPLQKEG